VIPITAFERQANELRREAGRVERIFYFQCPRCDDVFDQDSSAVIADVRGNNFCPHDRAALDPKIARVTVGGDA
jgi:hypothetical protein